MALVYRSSKEQIIKPVHNLGPGSYNPTQNNKNKKKNAQQSSVFASSTKRDPFEIKNQLIKKKQLGKMQQNESTNQVQNFHNGNASSPRIVKKYPDCKHIFNSKVQRFPQVNKVDQNQQSTKQTLLMEELKKILLKDINNASKGKILKNKDKKEIQNQLKGQNYQFFPSIPNWESSFGYRYDSESTKWVQNENPNVMLQIIESQKQQEKNNSAMGAGYYVSKNKQKVFHSPIKQDGIQNSLTDSMIYPQLKSKVPPSNSIQQSQMRLKARIRLLGKSPLKKTEQKLSKTQNFSKSQFIDNKQRDKKQHLVFGQMLKKFEEFIPEQQRVSPSNYLEKLKQNKLKTIQKKVLQNESKRNNMKSALHFLSKSYRFQTKQSEIDETNLSIQDNTSNINQNSSMILKSHNCKQTLLLGEKRFKQNYQIDPLGPGTYIKQNFLQKNKSSPCLNLKQKRFDSQISKNELPGPGQYDVTKDILKKQNLLGNFYSYYKQLKKEQISKNMRRQDSMESLYQSWGRQMNYIARLDQIQRLRQSQFKNQVNKKSQNQQKSIIKVRNQLQKSLKLEQSMTQSENIDQSLNSHQKSSMIYPKVTKHLYEYKQLPDDKKIEDMGPGKYQTRPQMIKKTFNVTYT